SRRSLTSRLKYRWKKKRAPAEAGALLQCLLSVSVDGVFETLAGLESRGLGGLHLDGLAGLGVAGRTCGTVANLESPETGERHLVALLQSVGDGIDDGVDAGLSFGLARVGGRSYCLDKLRLVHGSPPWRSNYRYVILAGFRLNCKLFRLFRLTRDPARRPCRARSGAPRPRRRCAGGTSRRSPNPGRSPTHRRGTRTGTRTRSPRGHRRNRPTARPWTPSLPRACPSPSPACGRWRRWQRKRPRKRLAPR